jgi:TrpR-related protein YerC/YecD
MDMKRRETLWPGKTSGRANRPAELLHPLLEAMLALKTPNELRCFLDDLCTPAELEAMADRWRVVPLLLKNAPYREIHDLTGVSVTTIGRIARCLAFGAGGYRLAAERLIDTSPKRKRAR